jgi:hypothetical protein
MERRSSCSLPAPPYIHQHSPQWQFDVPYRRIDGEEDGPRDQTAQKADDDEQFEVAHEQISVNGLVVQNVDILDVLEVLDPTEKARARGRRLALVANAVDIGARRVHATELATEDQEQGDEEERDQKGRYEGRDERGERVGFVSVGTRIRVGLLGSRQRRSQSFPTQTRHPSWTYSGKEV